MLKRLSVLLALILALAGGYVWYTQFNTKPNPLLSYVPADTPYLMAQTSPLPQALTDKLVSHYASAYQHAVHNLQRLQQQEQTPDAKRFQSLIAVLRVMQEKMSKQGLHSIGMDFKSPRVIYGLGLFPVMRVRIDDAARMNAFIDSLERKLNVTHSMQTYDGREYRLIDPGPMAFLIEVYDKDLIVSVLPKDRFKDYLPQLFGDKKPEQNLGDGRLLARLADRFGLNRGNLAFVDLKRVFEQVNDPGSTTRKLIAGLGRSQPKTLPPQCDALADYLLNAVPRLVFGLKQASASTMSARYAIETSDQVADWLNKLAVPVPGIGMHPDAVAEIGAGIDLDTLRDGLGAAVKGLIANANGCPLVDPAQMRAALPKLYLALNPMVTGVKGFDLTLDKLIMTPGAAEPRVEATLVAAVEHPMPMISLVTSFFPKLANLSIPDDGKPVALPMDGVVPGAPPLYLAVGKHDLALGVGSASQKRMTARLAESPNPAKPFVDVSYRPGELLAEIGPAIEANMQRVPPMQQMRMQDMLEQLRIDAGFATRTQFTTRASAHGLVLDYSMTLK